MGIATEEKKLEKTTINIFSQEIHLKTLEEIRKKYPDLCDRAKELVGDGVFEYCQNPYRNEKGEITCNGTWIVNSMHDCPDINMIHYLKYHEKYDKNKR